MRRFSGSSLLLVGILLACAATASEEETFPELRPDLKAPKGYSWKFEDGPDFYTWTLAEDKKEGEEARSGIGIYFGLNPSLEHIDEKTAKKVKGKVCSQDVTWYVNASDNPKDWGVGRDAVLTYEHGKGFLAIKLHVWIWAPTEKRVTELARQLESLKMVSRNK